MVTPRYLKRRAVQIRTGHATKATAVSDSDTASGPRSTSAAARRTRGRADRYSRRHGRPYYLYLVVGKRSMRVVDRGSGVPVVLVPGIQGRWEWMAPAVEALAARCRVITFSLADEPSAAWPARGIGFDAYVEQIGQALDAAPPRARRDLRRVVRRADRRGVSAPVSRTGGGTRAGFGDSAVLGARCTRAVLHAAAAAAAAAVPAVVAAAAPRRLPPRPRDGGRASPRRCGRACARSRISRHRSGWRAGRRSPPAPRWTGWPRSGCRRWSMTGEAGARPRGADGAHRGVHAHLAARGGRDARPHRPPGPGDAARGVCRRGRAVCRNLRGPAARDPEETGWLRSFARFPERWDRSSA